MVANHLRFMRLTCDVGEGLDDVDRQILPLIDCASIACGGHAGDAATAQNCIVLALENRVAIGAHPSYPDRANFGRLSQDLSEAELCASLAEQLQFIHSLCCAHSTQVAYVKPHGALYNDMMQRPGIYQTVLRSVAAFKRRNQLAGCKLLIQALPQVDRFVRCASQFGIDLWFEAFADRRYLNNGLLSSRAEPRAVIGDPAAVVEQAQNIAEGFVVTLEGERLALDNVDCLCLHSDNPAALSAAAVIRQ
ncbi:MAG: 5-oxoprolinase subunit PxpA [Cellvibrionaceae bacterium]|nr:5-oxoprolinase subunit PxpA [Cellvibrionaceae bacterium]